MSLSTLLGELEQLGHPGKGFKPHKHLLLLAVVQLFKKGEITNECVFYDTALREGFRQLLSSYGSAEDRNRPYNPFFHLGNTSFWKLIPAPGRETDLLDAKKVGGPTLLMELVHCAELSQDFRDAMKDGGSRQTIENLLLQCVVSGCQERESTSAEKRRAQSNTLQRLYFSESRRSDGNPFIGYLNSLQRLNASNENALAEYQSCNPFFSQIHVPHPITKTLLEELHNPGGRQIILTGHAGDGKSTVALDVYKHLLGIPVDQPLSKQLLPREDVPGTNISILKDLSERKRKDDDAFLQDILGGKRRFLIVSNTGALLDLFRAQADACGKSPVQMESDLLVAIGDERGEAELVVRGVRFLVINLARMDNLDLARRIFERMLDPERWKSCAMLECRSSCPICINVDLINQHRKIVFDRLFLAYRRMYEYGTRLTLRQLTEHLAYLITSGLEESDIADMLAKGQNPLRVEFMFFNRFFGDNGKADDEPALQMRAVREVRKQGFGERPCPTWERKLWLKARDDSFHLGVEDCEEEFAQLRDHGAGPGSDCQPGLTPDQAREQVRRMLFFLYEFPAEDASFLVHFLNSPTILRWHEWQEAGTPLEMTEKNILEQRIYHVLQEHFTGVRLPEGSKGNDRRLYITLSRGRNEIRQSAQVVVAQIDWSNETALELLRRQDASGGGRVDLSLNGRGRIVGAGLVLTLPFLDYVLMRHFGEVGEVLQAAYVERLERFKAQVQELAKEARAHVMLVRLKTDHTFRRQQYTVRDGKLEVNDVL